MRSDSAPHPQASSPAAANPEWVDLLRAAGYKITPSRLAVLHAVEHGGAHLLPAKILAAARVRAPTLGRATVYRTLDLLTQLGILRPIYVGEGGPSYIRAEGGHHHLVCSRCGCVVDFDRCIADEMVAELRERFGFEINSHLLEFYGLCPACRGRA